MANPVNPINNGVTSLGVGSTIGVSTGNYNPIIDDPNLRGPFQGIPTFYKIMDMQSYIAQKKFNEMNQMSVRAGESQNFANKISAVISEFQKPDSTGALPQDVLENFRKLGISVGNSDIDEYLYNLLSKADQTKVDNLVKQLPSNTVQKDIDDILRSNLTKGPLMTIKGELEKDASFHSDSVSQNQLEIQKILQSFNVAMSMISAMQTMMKETSQGIIQKI